MTYSKLSSSSRERPLIVLGGGGHAKVVIDGLLMNGRTILGFVDPVASCKNILGVKHLGGDDVVLRHQVHDIQLVNGVGSIGSCLPRARLFRKFRELGYRFAAFVHPSAIIAPEVRLGEGAQIMAGALIQTGSRIGVNSIVNTGAVVDHDCVIGPHAHVAPGVVLSGNVRIGTGSHVGTGASVIQSVCVGPWSIVGAGAVVIRNVPAGITAVGVPAKWQICKQEL